MTTLRAAPALALLLTAAACASGGTSSVAPSASSAGLPAVRTNDYGNIRWNKDAIHVYESKGQKNAVLTFWARDGYFVTPIHCQNGGTFDATAGKTHGNPNRYDHTRYEFTAVSKKPDTCTFTAILANTGSPPIATLTVDLNS
jgi:hypothetical protein